MTTIIKREFELIVIFIGCSVVASIVAMLIGFVWQRRGGNVDYALWVAFVLSVIGVFALSTYVDRLLKKLGRKSPISVFSGGGLGQGRHVPVNRPNGRKSHVFLSSLNLFGRDEKQIDTSSNVTLAEELEAPQTFTAIIDGIDYTIPIDDMRNFIHKAWARQRVGGAGFSRNYWTKNHRPKMDKTEYAAIMAILDQADLVINRTQGRSGKLSLPPEASIKILQGVF